MAETLNQPPMLADCVSIESVYTRAINLSIDAGALELIAAYQPTSRALECLRRIAAGLTADSVPRALAAIGPYGGGKSAFGLFVGALLSDSKTPTQQAAAKVLRAVDPTLTEQLTNPLAAGHGYLRVAVTGLPDSLQRQVLLALAIGAEQAGLAPTLIDHLMQAAETGPPMDEVLRLLRQVRGAWKHAGGQGVLIEIDELGQFLEYAAFHPEQRELHLLQLLAEHSRDPDPVPLQILVLLHQAFEHYGARLGRELRDDWQKVQGRFETVPFVESAEQALRVLAPAFSRNADLPPRISASLARSNSVLASEGALPHGLDASAAQELFARCYPLHPISLLILPTLCQKVAQNERTLFSYLGSREPFGLQERLTRLKLGEWIWPWDLYDYFILNQSVALTDGFTQHRWAEVVTALERLDISADDPEGPALAALLKTIGLFNLIGAQGGLKASPALLRPLFGSKLEALIARLEKHSAIHFRQFSQDYRVWAGSDFDLRAAFDEALLIQAGRSLADTLNELSPLKPIIARRATIAHGSLRAFIPRFTAADRWPPTPANERELTIWFYLTSPQEPAAAEGGVPGILENRVPGVVALCPFTDRLRTVVDEWMALRALPKYQAALHQDPVAMREYRAWLSHAEQEAQNAIRALVAAPEGLRWFFDDQNRNNEQALRHRRDLQERLSDWVERHYAQSPRLNNELINRDAPSPSANLARKRLIGAMLGSADQPQLGIEKTPAEKSLYLNLLEETGLHRTENAQLGLHPPSETRDPCRLAPLWAAIHAFLGNSGERQVPLPELYDHLRRPPFGVKLGPMPVILIAYLIIHQREVALYAEGIFCDTLSLEQAELLCRRPELFALERFDLGGLRGALFDRYLSDILGSISNQPTMLDVVRRLAVFLNKLPEYSQHCTDLSEPATRVRRAIQQATSPGRLLFDALPTACGISPEELAGNEPEPLQGFLERLIGALRELNQAYPALLEDLQAKLGEALLEEPPAELGSMRQALVARYHGLDALTPDKNGLGAFIRRLCQRNQDSGPEADQAWLESVAAFLAGAPPRKWRDETSRAAFLRLRERATQLKDLERLRLHEPAESMNGSRPLLLKRVDVEQGEITHVLHLSSGQRRRASHKAATIAEQLGQIADANERLAVVAELLQQLAKPAADPVIRSDGDVHVDK